MSWSNFDTSMLPRIGYACLLGIAMMVAAYLIVKLWDAAELAIKNRKTRRKTVRTVNDSAKNYYITDDTQRHVKLPPTIN